MYDDPILDTPQRTSARTLIGAGVSIAGAVFFFAIQSTVRTAASSTSSTSSESSRGTPGWFFGLMALFLVIQATATLLSWVLRTYTVTRSELVIDEGVLTRHHRVIPFARVQQVDLEQKLLMQVLGIQIVKISSAGEAGATTISLHALDTGDAERLRAFILRRREELHHGATGAAGSPSPPSGYAAAGAWVVDSSGHLQSPYAAPPPYASPPPGAAAGVAPPPGPPVGLLELGPGRLFAAAVTDLRLWAIPLLLVFGALIFASVAVARGEAAGGIISFGLVLVPLAFIVPFATIGQVVQKYGFTVTLQGDDLHLRYGLFEVRELTVPRRRVQQLTIIDNPVRRAFGLASLRLHSATSGGGPQATTFDIPLIDTAGLDVFLHTMMGTTMWQVPPLTPRNDRAKARAITRRVGVLVLAVAAPAALLRPNGPALLLLALLGIPWGLVAHKRAGHGRTSAVVAFAHGALDHRIDLVPIERIQSCRVLTSPFQRRAKLATLHADVAAARRAPNLYDMDDATARDLVHVLPRLSSPTAAVDQRF